MGFDVGNINQSTNFIDVNIFYPMYKNLHEVSKKTSLIRFASPFIGLTDGFISTAQAVTGIAEATIKGSVNIFGRPFSDNFNLKRGILQLSLGGVIVSIVTLPIIVIRILKITICFFTNPEKLTQTQADIYLSKIKNDSLV